jgi:hypothetical protein
MRVAKRHRHSPRAFRPRDAAGRRAYRCLAGRSRRCTRWRDEDRAATRKHTFEELRSEPFERRDLCARLQSGAASVPHLPRCNGACPTPKSGRARVVPRPSESRERRQRSRVRTWAHIRGFVSTQASLCGYVAAGTAPVAVVDRGPPYGWCMRGRPRVWILLALCAVCVCVCALRRAQGVRCARPLDLPTAHTQANARWRRPSLEARGRSVDEAAEARERHAAGLAAGSLSVSAARRPTSRLRTRIPAGDASGQKPQRSHTSRRAHNAVDASRSFL